MVIWLRGSVEGRGKILQARSNDRLVFDTRLFELTVFNVLMTKTYLELGAGWEEQRQDHGYVMRHVVFFTAAYPRTSVMSMGCDEETSLQAG
jgi:hypothetical protein